MNTICSNCNKTITISPYQKIRRANNFCSPKCAGEFRQRRTNLICPICSKSFIVKEYRAKKNKQIYCSRLCLFYGHRVETTCAFCGKTIRIKKACLKPRNYCSPKCQHLYQSKYLRGTNHPRWTGTHYQDRGHTWPQARHQTLKRDNKTCQNCGTKSKIVVHHKIPIRKFQDPNDANYLDNLVTLCRACHAKIEPPIK